MRLFLFISIFAVISCAHHELSPESFKPFASDIVSFWTPVGVLMQGASMTEIKEVLGSPKYKDIQGEYVLWQYENISDENVFIIFQEGLLYWVKFENRINND